MSQSKRRSLADEDAAAFVFGDSAEEQTPKTKPSPAKKAVAKQTAPKAKPKKQRAIDQILKTPEQERQVRMTVDLNASQHHRFSLAAAKLGQSKVEIVRALIDDFLTEIEQQ